ncbi:hypothetical protein ONZ45_g1279 [Pleurotus djamor]|nr:hypothetical protein ONZ45_g1279 [Pleurotus djamor]
MHGLEALLKPTHPYTFYIEGAVDLPPQASKLFFNRGDTGGIIYLLNPTLEQAGLLATVCEPASFGRNHENVLDENYRKAGKLDPSDFAFNFDPAATGILDKVKSELLTEIRPIKAELYKLNLYGPGSFFKAHKDTPRSESMFGSLVLVLPIPHEGGELVLRPAGQDEIKFDSSASLTSRETPGIAYIAFYGDIEHEVLQVKSGNRVTLTYNLYFDERPVEVSQESILKHPLAVKLVELLEKPDILAHGGLIGYALRHEYPVSKYGLLTNIKKYLKSEDATVARICDALQLKSAVKVVYAASEYSEARYVALDTLYDPPAPGSMEYHEDGLFNVLISEVDAFEIYWKGHRDERWRNSEDEDPRYEVVWINEPIYDGPIITYLAYGNEATLDYVYGHVDLLNPTNDQLELLASACEPASFGRNNEDILDETYRKAGKLNVSDFSTNLDLTAAGIIAKIRSELLTDHRNVRAELYKLNVYGPGSFFKAHKDTPRGESMFGSLVLVLPIPYEGGELVLRPTG